MFTSECSSSELLDNNMESDYEEMTELDWAEYQFATIEYDYNIHPKAAAAIRAIFEQLATKF